MILDALIIGQILPMLSCGHLKYNMLFGC